MTDRNAVRRQWRFYGLVQGVGFRWRACRAARAAGATGWVRNERDGSVTVEIQGTPEQLDSVMQSLHRGLYIRIERVDERLIPLAGDERDFTARDDAW